jgi:hypothetical protein
MPVCTNVRMTRWGAGGDASTAELESSGTRDPRWLIDRANAFLDAGAHVRGCFSPRLHLLYFY